MFKTQHDICWKRNKLEALFTSKANHTLEEKEIKKTVNC